MYVRKYICPSCTNRPSDPHPPCCCIYKLVRTTSKLTMWLVSRASQAPWYAIYMLLHTYCRVRTYSTRICLRRLFLLHMYQSNADRPRLTAGKRRVCVRVSNARLVLGHAQLSGWMDGKLALQYDRISYHTPHVPQLLIQACIARQLISLVRAYISAYVLVLRCMQMYVRRHISSEG